MNLKILYRGHVTDCNFACPYCPFAKTKNDAAQRKLDRDDLARFVDWVESHGPRGWTFQILFTPYGEALIHPWYREAMVRLSGMAHVSKVAAQTNLSWSTGWTERLDPAKAAFWATFHPLQAKQDSFLDRCRELSKRGIPHSVGVVGLREHFPAIQTLRRALPETTYLWVNAFKRQEGYYTESEIAHLESIDPRFRDNLPYYPTRGRSCAAGSGVVAIEGNGDLYRCHFDRDRKGNIFQQELSDLLRAEPCRQETCHCHIGYVHAPHLGLAEVYGEGILERIPERGARTPAERLDGTIVKGVAP